VTVIQAVDVRAIAIQRTSTLTTAYGPRNDATTVLVQMKTDDGLTGLGQAAVDQPYYGETAEGMLANIRTYLAPGLIGQNPFDITRLAALLERTLPGHEASRSALEMALWDIKGKALGVPVYQLLGGKLHAGISVMGSLAHGEPDAMAESVLETLDRVPYSTIKLKVGMGIDDDVRRYKAVREAVGDRAALQVDANAAYTYGDAILALSRLIDIGNLVMIDQPVASLDDMAALARMLAVPLMADEAIGGPADALEIVKRRAASAGFLKIAKHGGMLNVQKIATIFEAAGMAISMGIYYDVIAAAAAHLSAALPAVTWPSAFTDLNDTILTEPLVPDGLLLRVPEGPGLGVDLDPEQVERLTVLN
jgi:L-alanine-DL-glutamate epimerase-like enolase superfamily enzyme